MTKAEVVMHPGPRQARVRNYGADSLTLIHTLAVAGDDS